MPRDAFDSEPLENMQQLPIRDRRRKEETKNRAQCDWNDSDLKAFLDEHGASTRQDILKGLGWHASTLKAMLNSPPEWLVAPGIKVVGASRFVLLDSSGNHVLGKCSKCGVKNFHPMWKNRKKCIRCKSPDGNPRDGVQPIDTRGVDGSEPAMCKPGSDEKMKYLAARYAQGLELWHEGDADWEYESEDWE